MDNPRDCERQDAENAPTGYARAELSHQLDAWIAGGSTGRIKAQRQSQENEHDTRRHTHVVLVEQEPSVPRRYPTTVYESRSDDIASPVNLTDGDEQAEGRSQEGC